MKAILIDTDYKMNKINEPVVRLYCKLVETDNDGEDIVIHVSGFEPYIYIFKKEFNIFEFKKNIEIVCKGYVKRVEIVKKFLPIGYQVEKSDVLKLVLFTPKVVENLRILLKERIQGLTDNNMFEADIPYKNRFLVDNNIEGMSIIEFNEKGKELKNYGLQCNKLYICNVNDIRVLKNEVIVFDY